MAAKQNPRYKGKNFKPDFADPRRKPLSWAEDVENSETNVEKFQSHKSYSAPSKRALPGPSNIQKAHPTALKDEPLFKESIFGEDVDVKENNMRTSINPNLIGLIPTAEETWIQLSVDDVNIGKEQLVEGFRYYATALLWLRIIELKKANSQPLTEAEDALFMLCSTTTFNIPTPIFLYLRSLGTLKCAATGQTLIPEFPPLPAQVIQNRGGYYGPLEQETHNLYEEVPCLGVMVEALQTALGDAPPGHYNSSLAPENLTVNRNLLGYAPLVNRRNEAKNFFLNIGITDAIFQEYPASTGFNYDLVFAISTWLSTTTTFKLEEVHFSRFETNGSQSQVIIERPVVDGVAGPVRNITGDIIATALMRDNKTTFGLAQYNLFELMKENNVNAAEVESIRARAWCCVDYTAQNMIPQPWINNRNQRRNIPPEYLVRRFETVSQNNANLRKRTVAKMVIAKR